MQRSMVLNSTPTKGQKGNRYIVFSGHLVWGMAKFPDSSPRLKKTTSDTAYLSDSLQGQLLHKVNFISFFQMFVLQNGATNATIKKSLTVIYYINIPKQTITVADLEILY